MEQITRESFYEMNATQIAQFETQKDIFGELLESENGYILCRVIGEEETSYIFKEKSITLYDALKELQFTTELKITYSENVKYDNDGSSYYDVSEKEYLNSEIRKLPLSKFVLV
jgi:hypothetical protein